jgi:lipid-A-disaccharide synthase
MTCRFCLMGLRFANGGRPRVTHSKLMTDPSSLSTAGPLVFISAAEPSADLHAAALIRATRAVAPGVRFVGVAGPKMVDAGCECIFDMTTHSAMLLGVFRAIPRAIRMLSTAEQHLRRYSFDAAVLIDSPTLHLPLAAKAKAVGVPVLYYIAPQLWAWGSHRIHKLRNNVTHLACILPFEEEYFRSQGVDATFVGHPLAESTASMPVNESIVERIRSRGSPIVALLPGSRRHVVNEVLPGQLDVASAIVRHYPKAHIGVSIAGASVAATVDQLISRSEVRLERFTEHREELIRAADLVLVASGTACLEVAFHERPMIVMYNASRSFYWLFARWMIRTPHLALPNILAGREIVPEFMPYYRSTEPIVAKAIELLRSPDHQTAMRRALKEVVAPLRESNASGRTATILLNIIAQNRRH